MDEKLFCNSLIILTIELIMMKNEICAHLICPLVRSLCVMSATERFYVSHQFSQLKFQVSSFIDIKSVSFLQ